LGKTYAYRAQAVDGPVESGLSEPVSITFEDKFAPRPPSGVTAILGLESIELAWEPNTEPDLAGYRVYRALGSGEFSLLADAVEGPSFSDRMAAASGVHRYRVTAVDRSGNESGPSQVVELTR
jgi:fibronectin type 3 domain-containing protein